MFTFLCMKALEHFFFFFREGQNWYCLRSWMEWAEDWTGFQGGGSANPPDFTRVPRACLAQHAHLELRDSRSTSLSPSLTDFPVHRSSFASARSVDPSAAYESMTLKIYSPVSHPPIKIYNVSVTPKHFSCVSLKLIPDPGPQVTLICLPSI